MSHSPMMAAEGEYWLEFAKADLVHKGLFDETGKHVTYDELNKQRESRYEELALQTNMINLHQIERILQWTKKRCCCHKA